MATQTYPVLNTNVYRFNINDRIIHIVNYGEIHYQAPKLDLSVYEDKKTCFYLEYPFRIFNKRVDFIYFSNLNPKKKSSLVKTCCLQSKTKVTTTKLSPKERLHKKIKPYDNRYHISKHFGKWYLNKGYIFNDDTTIPLDLKDKMKSDLTIATKYESYNELWDLCPCDYRHKCNSIFGIITDLINILQHYYLYILKYNDGSHTLVDFKQYMFINYDIPSIEIFLTKIPKTFEEFFSPIKSDPDYFKVYDLLPITEKTENDQYKRIYEILVKYVNNDKYQNIIENPSIDNIMNYFKDMDLTQLTIDIFNVNTCFYYEEDLKKYPDIIEFINMFYSLYHKTILFGPCNITSYDIILLINLNKNIEKYDYHVIYNGLFHCELFKYYMLFFEQKYRLLL